MVKRLKINTSVVSTYISQSNVSIDFLREKVKNIDQILSGEIDPTFDQLSKIAKKINVPTGLLLLDKPIDKSKTRLEFRTLNSTSVDEMSPELRDTILEMQEKQNFLREEVENECAFVGMFTLQDDDEKILEKIYSYLGTEISPHRFNVYRDKIGKLGVFIFLNGKVKDNTHRGLSIGEFRGFVLVDKKAPLIFINQKDSNKGRLFTLIHEFVHLFFGDSDVLSNYNSISHTQLEAKINRITAEILLPKQLLIEKFDREKSIDENLENLAKYFEISRFVVLRRLYDLKYISKEVYSALNDTLEKEFLKRSNNPEKSSNGNYNNNLKYRIDRHFVNYVDNAVKQNRLSYTDAFNIIGVGYKGYQVLIGNGV